ncbi:MAG TPA: hypothetical protein VKY31_09390, partial [Terriglobia bacterium]|nr:hypothetical protein [Terriglobia bacterium]
PFVTVGDNDVTGVQIRIPAEKDVRVVITTEDNTPAPAFVMTLATSGSTVSVVGKPTRDGSFAAKLPMDERQFRITGFPLGYVLKAAAYKGNDLLRQPLKISKDDTDELHVTFGPDPSLPFGNLKGRITGLDPAASRMRVSLSGVTSFLTFDTSVGTDGAFSVSSIPQGAYMAVLIEDGAASVLSPSTIVVSGSDPFTVQLAATHQPVSLESPSAEGDFSGVTVSGSAVSRQAANESSAVAQLRTINTAEVTYMAAHGGSYGSIPDMIDAGLLDKRFGATISGFNYSVISADRNYVAAAVPETQNAGRFGYFSANDAIIRFSMPDFLSPASQGGKPVR